MYNYIDSSGFIAAIYFPVLVVLGSFFLLNLFLAVIMETFQEMNKKQHESEKAKQLEKLNKIKAIEEEKNARKVSNMINVAKKKMQV